MLFIKTICYNTFLYIESKGIFMIRRIGKFKSSIAALELTETTLCKNTLILGEEGSGKTHLANIIREYVIDNGVPTLYLDFSNPDDNEVEERFKHSGNYYYMRFEESEAFDTAFSEAVGSRKHIYLAVNPNYFSNKRELKSRLSRTIQSPELLENYYYFFHEIALLNAFYTKFEDFLRYIFDLINMKKYGLTFLTQPHEIFEDAQTKLLFSSLYLGKCSNANYFNTSVLKKLSRNTFYYQYRMEHKSLMFNDIKSDIVAINE